MSTDPAIATPLHPASRAAGFAGNRDGDSNPSAVSEEENGDKAKTLARLRERIARIEGRLLHRLEAPGDTGQGAGPLPEAGGESAAIAGKARPRAHKRHHPLGIAEVDAALGGGFPVDGLTEIHVDETRRSGTGAGFALSLAVLFGADAARPLLWAGSRLAFFEAGMPYLPGLVGHGLDPSGLCLVRTRRLDEAIWVGEEAARSTALAMVVLEVGGNPGRLALEGTRRLHLRARQSGTCVLLLRQGGRAETTAAPLRLRISPGPAARVPAIVGPGTGAESVDLSSKLIGHPVFRIAIEKSPDGRPQDFTLEWSPHDRSFQNASTATAQSHDGRPSPSAAHRQDPARHAGPLLALRRAS